ncbi:hypothetical protein Btru_066355 [Bulinus truncatus]|nr:hypothetical protein Btru_066355 [Bulinus truncatus]
MLLNLFILYISTTVLTQAQTPDLLTQEVIDAFLQFHNDARAAVSVPPMVWDEILSNYTTERSSNCDWNENEEKYGLNNLANNYYMQPVFYVDNLIVVRDVFEQWNSEKVNVDIPNWYCIDRQRCSSYSQIVWRNTQRVGCAITHCKDEEWQTDFVACSYDPPGNVGGEKPY